jgi:methylmalonyl-CoA/ethylmalonyl-CoA epimerase
LYIVALNEAISKTYKIFMLKIEHLGIAVADLQKSIPLFEQLLNTPCYKTEVVENEGVSTAFFQLGESKVELLEATRPDSPIGRFIEKKGEGIHHIAIEVENIEAEMKRLSALGFTLLNEQPKDGADNKLICFLHPKTTNGVLIELCQEKRF